MATSTRLSASERTLRARAAAFALHASGGTSTAAGTRAFLDRFEREVDPDGVLNPDERAKRAAFARRSSMARAWLSNRAVRVRAYQVARSVTSFRPAAA